MATNSQEKKGLNSKEIGVNKKEIQRCQRSDPVKREWPRKEDVKA